MTDNEQLTSLATHLYVRLRRDGGRVIDVIWLMRNQEYAREVLKLARSIPEPELEKLTDRIEELIFGTRGAAAARPLAPSAEPTEAQLSSLSSTGRYKGGLR